MLNSKSLKELHYDLKHRTLTFRALGLKYSAHEVTIRRYNVKYGFKRPKINHDAILHDIKSGITQDLIAEKHNIDTKTIYNIKKRNGLVKHKGVKSE